MIRCLREGGVVEAHTPHGLHKPCERHDLQHELSELRDLCHLKRFMPPICDLRDLNNSCELSDLCDPRDLNDSSDFSDVSD